MLIASFYLTGVLYLRGASLSFSIGMLTSHQTGSHIHQKLRIVAPPQASTKREVPMFATLETFRGVRCHHCGKTIRVSKQVTKRLEISETEEHKLFSQVFVLRCRSCQKESVYTVNQVVNAPVNPLEETHTQ